MIKDFASFGFWGQRYDFFFENALSFSNKYLSFSNKKPEKGNMAYCFRSVAL